MFLSIYVTHAVTGWSIFHIPTKYNAIPHVDSGIYAKSDMNMTMYRFWIHKLAIQWLDGQYFTSIRNPFSSMLKMEISHHFCFPMQHDFPVGIVTNTIHCLPWLQTPCWSVHFCKSALNLLTLGQVSLPLAHTVLESSQEIKTDEVKDVVNTLTLTGPHTHKINNNELMGVLFPVLGNAMGLLTQLMEPVLHCPTIVGMQPIEPPSGIIWNSAFQMVVIGSCAVCSFTDFEVIHAHHCIADIAFRKNGGELYILLRRCPRRALQHGLENDYNWRRCRVVGVTWGLIWGKYYWDKYNYKCILVTMEWCSVNTLHTHFKILSQHHIDIIL